MKELWKDICGYEGIYRVSSGGKIKRVKTGRILKWSLNKRKFCTVHLYKDESIRTFYVHRLVALSFIPNPSDLPDINHKNRNRMDNRSENLEWVSKRQNNVHARITDWIFLIDEFRSTLTLNELERSESVGGLLTYMKTFVHKKWASK